MPRLDLLTIMIWTTLRVIFFESRSDYLVIKDPTLFPSDKWKFWANANDLAQITLITAIFVWFEGWAYLLFLPIQWLTWWIVHDLAMGYRMVGSVWHFGAGDFDQWAKKVFKTGPLYLMFKTVWLIILSGIFLSLTG